MALNFEQAQFVDPKIQIAPRELPVEEMMKVGNVLQDRFDKAMENETKTQAIARKLKSSSNPADHAVADQIMSNYNQRQKDRSTNGRYQDMQWQTQQDALDVAGMYEGLSNRAKQIAEYEKAIDLNTVNSPEIKKFQKEKYRKSIMQSQFDPEKRILQGLDVSAPNIVNAFDYEKHMMDLAGQWKPDTRGSKTVKEVWIPRGAKAPDGSISPGSNYKVLDNHFTEQVKAQDLRNHLEKSALSNEMLQAALKQDREVYGDDVAFKRYHNAINAAIDAKSYIKQLENEHSAEMTIPKTNGQGDGYDNTNNLGTFTQRPSALFNQNKEGDPFKVDAMGNIIQNKPISKGISFTRDEFGIHDPNAKNAFSTDGKLNLSKLEDSVTYKRLKNHLTQLGAINSKSNKKEINLAIVNFWNQLGNAESSIAVAQPGDKKANDYVAEINRSYFGTPTPDANTKGTSILNGQLAQATFINEKGEKMPAYDVYGETKNRNVRITGWVNQVEAPFEYGSHYMVAIDPESNEEKHYLVEPDINTKNSGAYFANRIFNSTREKNLVSKWKDGNGVNYEATPVKGKGGDEYIIYVNNDVKTPIILDSQDLQALSSLPAGEANQVLENLYNQKQ
jgi:hypothetical protein